MVVLGISVYKESQKVICDRFKTKIGLFSGYLLLLVYFLTYLFMSILLLVSERLSFSIKELLFPSQVLSSPNLSYSVYKNLFETSLKTDWRLGVNVPYFNWYV